MPYLLIGHTTELLISIFSKMDRIAFLRLYRSCKSIHKTIEENKMHIRNYVTNDKLMVIIRRPTIYDGFEEDEDSDEDEPRAAAVPLFYKLTVKGEEAEGYISYGVLSQKTTRFNGMRLAELNIYAVKMDYIIELVEYFYTRNISCEKLTIFFPQDLQFIPDELIDFLRPLKLVILPIERRDIGINDDDILGCYEHFVDKVDHISLVQVRESDVKETLFHRNVLGKTSFYMHHIHNFREEDDPLPFDRFYKHLRSFYQRFLSNPDAKLKDFQFYFQCYQEEDTHILRDQDPDDLLNYIIGKWERPRVATTRRQDPLDGYDYREHAKVLVKDPVNPNMPPVRSGLAEGPEPWGGTHKRYWSSNNEKNMKKNVLVKTWSSLTEGCKLDRMLLSITEGRKEGEHVMTLFAQDSEKLNVYFAIVPLTDWFSYKRFLGLMDTKNFDFPMEEVEDDVKKILCP